MVQCFEYEDLVEYVKLAFIKIYLYTQPSMHIVLL